MTRPAGFSRALAYPILVGVPLLGLLVVLRLGASLPTPTAQLGVAGADSQRADAVLHLGNFLAQIVVVLTLSRLVGKLLGRVGQPYVVGEMLAGILLGPSVLGLVWPQAYASLFPLGTVRFLGAVSQLGLVLFMFLVGLELRAEDLRGRGHAAVLASHTSIVFPLFLGAALALPLYPRLGMPGVGFTAFALFLGAAMSVTAFPVLARLLAERNLTHTPLGAVAIACAAVDDVTAWCILAVVVAIARTNLSFMSLGRTVIGSALFAAVMFLVVRPLLAKLAQRHERDGRLTPDMIAITVLVALVSAWTTEWLGVHALFGAFVAGVVMPRNQNFERDVARSFEDLMMVVLLPLFFAATGIRASIGLITSPTLLGLFGLVLAVAIAGKIGGSAVAARVSGLGWREAFSLGALMNTRGLMGLVIVSVGVEMGVLSPPLYVMMVLMCIITTCMTTPLLAVLRGRTASADLTHDLRLPTESPGTTAVG